MRAAHGTTVHNQKGRIIDPASPSNANELLRAQGLRPRKRWGQNFLCDRNVLDRIVRAAALTPDSSVLEIGAGLGALTRALAASASRVTSVEIDHLMEPILADTLAGYDNVRLVFEDFLKLDIEQLLDDAFGDKPGVVVANIPYYITTPILERLLMHKTRVSRIVLLVQVEFADRLAAKPGTKDYGSMTVFAQYHTHVEIEFKVSRHVFLPQPEVGSAVVSFEPISPGSVIVSDEDRFFRIVRVSFQERRKTIANALMRGLDVNRATAEGMLAAAGIDAGRRGETLSLEEFAHLANRSANTPPGE